MEKTKITTRQRCENYDAGLGAAAAPPASEEAACASEFCALDSTSQFLSPPPPAEPCAGLSVALHHGTSAQHQHRGPAPGTGTAARPFLRECPRPPARQNFARSIAPPNFRAPRPNTASAGTAAGSAADTIAGRAAAGTAAGGDFYPPGSLRAREAARELIIGGGGLKL